MLKFVERAYRMLLCTFPPAERTSLEAAESATMLRTIQRQSASATAGMDAGTAALLPSNAEHAAMAAAADRADILQLEPGARGTVPAGPSRPPQYPCCRCHLRAATQAVRVPPAHSQFFVCSVCASQILDARGKPQMGTLPACAGCPRAETASNPDGLGRIGRANTSGDPPAIDQVLGCTAGPMSWPGPSTAAELSAVIGLKSLCTAGARVSASPPARAAATSSVPTCL